MTLFDYIDNALEVANCDLKSFDSYSNDSDRIRSVSFLACKRLYFSPRQSQQLHGVLLSLYFLANPQAKRKERSHGRLGFLTFRYAN